MSSCFLCDCSYKFSVDNDRYRVTVGTNNQCYMFMKYRSIMIGSSCSSFVGNYNNTIDDQQHTGGNKQNYVSYLVKKLEFECDMRARQGGGDGKLPDYFVIFKVPFRKPIIDYYFTLMKEFILYSEPENVLGYDISQNYTPGGGVAENPKNPRRTRIVINKPFVVGPNDYVGVFYMFNAMDTVDANAKVWFDVL